MASNVNAPALIRAEESKDAGHGVRTGWAVHSVRGQSLGFEPTFGNESPPEPPFATARTPSGASAKGSERAHDRFEVRTRDIQMEHRPDHL